MEYAPVYKYPGKGRDPKGRDPKRKGTQREGTQRKGKGILPLFTILSWSHERASLEQLPGTILVAWRNPSTIT